MLRARSLFSLFDAAVLLSASLSFFFSVLFQQKISKSADAVCTDDRLFTSFDQFGSSIAIFQMSYQQCILPSSMFIDYGPTLNHGRQLLI